MFKKYGASWGKSPQGPSDAERANADELVLQSWAFCKAKKNPLTRRRTAEAETARKASVQWRKRLSFVELDCGDDSFMVSNTYNAVGVADGVGDWKSAGGDSAAVANTLMANSKLYSETHRSCADASTILSEALKKMKVNGETPGGSTTACVAALRQSPTKTEPRSGLLDVVNIGNSNAMLIRNQTLVHRAQERMHSFNAPFQLLVPPKGGLPKNEEVFDDSVGDAAHEQWNVEDGDVLVLATDGLFDNVFNSEIASIAGALGRFKTTETFLDYIPAFGAILSRWMGFAKPDAAQLDPYRVTKQLGMMAHDRAYGGNAETPFSLMVSSVLGEQKTGGKPDDITVLVARVVKREELARVHMW